MGPCKFLGHLSRDEHNWLVSGDCSGRLYRWEPGNSNRGDTGSELAAGFWNRRLACIIDYLDTGKIEGAR